MGHHITNIFVDRIEVMSIYPGQGAIATLPHVWNQEDLIHGATDDGGNSVAGWTIRGTANGIDDMGIDAEHPRYSLVGGQEIRVHVYAKDSGGHWGGKMCSYIWSTTDKTDAQGD